MPLKKNFLSLILVIAIIPCFIKCKPAANSLINPNTFIKYDFYQNSQLSSEPVISLKQQPESSYGMLSDMFSSDFNFANNFQQPLYQSASVNEPSRIYQPSSFSASSSFFEPSINDQFRNGGYSNGFSDFQLPLIPQITIADHKNTGLDLPNSFLATNSEFAKSFSQTNDPFGELPWQKKTGFEGLDYSTNVPTYGAASIKENGPESNFGMQSFLNDFTDNFFPDSSISMNSFDLDDFANFDATSVGISSFKNTLSNKLFLNNIMKETFSRPLDKTITDTISAITNSVAKSFNLQNYQAFDYYNTALKNVLPGSDSSTYIEVLSKATDDLLKNVNILNSYNEETNADLAAKAINEGILNLKKEINVNNDGFMDAFDSNFSPDLNFDLNDYGNIISNSDSMKNLDSYAANTFETVQPMNLDIMQQANMNNGFTNAQLDKQVDPTTNGTENILQSIITTEESTTQPLTSTDLEIRNQETVSANKAMTAEKVLENGEKRVPIASTLQNKNVGEIDTVKGNADFNTDTLAIDSEAKRKDIEDVKTTFSNLLKSKILKSGIVTAGLQKEFSQQDITLLTETYSQLLSDRFDMNANITNPLYTTFTKTGFRKDEENIAKIVAEVTGEVLNTQGKLISSKLNETVDTAFQCIELSLSRLLNSKMDINTVLQASAKNTGDYIETDNSSAMNIDSGKAELQTLTSRNITNVKSEEKENINSKKSKNEKSVEIPILFKNADKTDISVESLNMSTGKQQKELILNDSIIKKQNTDLGNDENSEQFKITFSKELKTRIIESQLLEALIERKLTLENFTNLVDLYAKKMEEILHIQVDANTKKLLCTGLFKANDYADVFSSSTASFLIEAGIKKLNNQVMNAVEQSISFSIAKFLENQPEYVPQTTEIEKFTNFKQDLIADTQTNLKDKYFPTEVKEKMNNDVKTTIDLETLTNSGIRYDKKVEDTSSKNVSDTYTDIKIDSTKTDAKTDQVSEDENTKAKYINILKKNLQQSKILSNIVKKGLTEQDSATLSNIYCKLLSEKFKIQIGMNKAQVLSNELLKINTLAPSEKDYLDLFSKFTGDILLQEKILTASNMDTNKEVALQCISSSISEFFNVNNISSRTSSSVNINQNLDDNYDSSVNIDKIQLKDNNKSIGVTTDLGIYPKDDAKEDLESDNKGTIRDSNAMNRATEKDSLITDADKTSASIATNVNASNQNQQSINSNTLDILSREQSKDDLKLENKDLQSHVTSTVEGSKKVDTSNNLDLNTESIQKIQQKFASDFGKALALSEDFKLSIITRDMETIITAIADAVEATSGFQTSDAFLNTFNASLKT